MLSNNGDDVVDKLRFFSDYIVFSDDQLPVTFIIYGRAFSSPIQKLNYLLALLLIRKACGDMEWCMTQQRKSLRYY